MKVMVPSKVVEKGGEMFDGRKCHAKDGPRGQCQRQLALRRGRHVLILRTQTQGPGPLQDKVRKDN